MLSKASVLAAIAILSVSCALTWLVRRLALAHGVMDQPNERSSHVVPTPRGGGAAIVAVTTAVILVLFLLGKVSVTTFGILGGGGLAVALVGFVDDHRQVSTRVRLTVHLVAAVWAMLLLGGLPPIQVGGHLFSFGWAGYPLGVLAIVWMLNLFNFMDGIDGIAASEAAFVSIAGAILAGSGGLMAGISAAGLALGLACIGFLYWNWPPARVFMGDVGSGYLGYFLACLALIAAQENAIALPVFLILGAVFVVDATVTFVRRIARHERYDVAHRTHGYQRLSRRWRAHLPVTIAVLAFDLIVLLPAAVLALNRPRWAVAIAGLALVLLLGVSLAIGSGRAEARST
jgi:Fuc2NAc and GlcNAc transferase